MNKISRQYRKFCFYLINGLQFALIPRRRFRRQLKKKLSRLTPDNQADIMDRVNYYNKLSKEFEPGHEAVRCGSLRPGKKNAYFFDLYKTMRYFDPDLRMSYRFGDVTTVPETPKIVKSRPINGDNQNSILMKLNQVRHFYFVPRDKPFEAKKDKVVWRGKRGNKRSRIKLIQQCAGAPVCDLGYTDEKSRNDPNHRAFLSIKKQLDFKFILSIEGNDVATNLKWIMSSNSLCLMPKPRYETWFMEGTLAPDHHYVLLRDDGADIEEKVDHYVNHPEEALKIIDNAHNYIEPFKNAKREELIQLFFVFAALSGFAYFMGAKLIEKELGFKLTDNPGLQNLLTFLIVYLFLWALLFVFAIMTRRKKIVFVSLVAFSASLVISLKSVFLPGINPFKSERYLAEDLAAHWSEGARVGLWGSVGADSGFIFYNGVYYDKVFSDSADVRAFLSGAGKQMLIVNKEKKLRQNIPESVYENKGVSRISSIFADPDEAGRRKSDRSSRQSQGKTIRTFQIHQFKTRLFRIA